MLLAILLITIGTSNSSDADWELHLDEQEFDWTTKSQFIRQTQLVVVSQFRSFDQLYQVKMDLINIHDKTLEKTLLVGDQTQDNYSPQIKVMDQYIYVAYVNQVGSMINLKLNKYDLDLVDQQLDITLGESLEQAKFDETFCYIQMDLIKQDTLGISWYSRGQQYNQRQWNFRTLHKDALTDTFILPDSKYISVAQNSYGITAFVQQNDNQIYFSTLGGQLYTLMYSNDKPEVFSLPNNQFIIYYSGRLRYFNHNFEPIGDDWYFGVIPTIQDISKHVIDYNLYLVCSNNQQITVFQIDVRQQLPYQTRTLSFSSQLRSFSIDVDIIENSQLYVRWLYQEPQLNNYKLSLFYFDMSFYFDECVSNCISCNPKYKCQQCKEGYTNINNKCVAICPDNCDFCSNPNYCDQCTQGFQYTADNLCIKPQIDLVEFQISNEEYSKGQPRILIIDNQIVIIYGVYDPNQFYLKIKTLNSMGQVLQQNYLKSSTLKDYDITSGNDNTSFFLITQWNQDGVSSIILYMISLTDLSVSLEQQLQLTDSSLLDQIRIEKLQSLGIGIIYTTILPLTNYIQLNYLRIDNDGVQSTLSTFVIGDKYDLKTYSQQDIIFVQINTHLGSEVYKLNQYTIENSYLNIPKLWDPYYQELQLFNYQNAYLYTDYNDYSRQLYLSISDDKNDVQIIQLTQTSRNPRAQTAKLMGTKNAFIIWLGFTNIQDPQQREQVYLQRVSLETYSITQYTSICSQNCISCDDLNCLQCKNDYYSLSNGKCQLNCPQDCKKCEKENECQACSDSHYLNHSLQCILYEQKYLNQQDGYLGIFVSYSNTELQQVSLKFNNTKYDVIYEEFDRKGNSISGEILIPIIDGYYVIPKQPKVQKNGQFIIISFFTQSTQYDTVSNLVVLDAAYSIVDQQQFQPSCNFEIDYMVSSDSQIYRVVAYLNSDQTIQRFQLDSLMGKNANIAYATMQFVGNQKIKNFRFMSLLSNFIVQYTTITENEVSDNLLIYDTTTRQFKDPIKHSNIQLYQFNQMNCIVLQDVISVNLAKIQFYNGNYELQNEYQIESHNSLTAFNLLCNNDYIYLLYMEQINSIQLMQIQLIQYTLAGLQNQKITLNTNELEIKHFSATVNDEFLTLAWTSAKSKTVYKTLLTKELQTIAIDSICMKNCKLCENSQSCNQCYPGYTNIQNCQPICIDNCQSCSKPYTCDYCIENYVYVDSSCLNIYDLKLENTICSDTCYAPAQMVTLDKTIISYLDYDSQVYSIVIYAYGQTLAPRQQLLIQSTQIYYHQIFKYNPEQFALVWLSGDCQIQCRLMLQLFNNDLTIVTNPYELRVFTVDLNQMNLQINNFNSDIIFVWTELDINSLSNGYSIQQTYVGQYNIYTGFTIQYSINQGQYPILITQSAFYQVVYLINNNINVMTIEGSNQMERQQQIYTTLNFITSLSVIHLPQGILVGWIERGDFDLTLQYKLCLQLFDSNFNAQGSYNVLPTRFRQISNLQILNINFQYISVFYVEQDTQRIRVCLIDANSLNSPQLNILLQSPINFVSQYEPGSIFTSYQNQQGGILYQGTFNNKRYIFLQQEGFFINHSCPSKCFYCDQDNICLICEEGSQLKEEYNLCVLALPDYCVIGQNGICQQCNDGYTLNNNACISHDPQYKEIKMNSYSLQSKQRTSTFSNGDYIAVWFRRYYENQGTGVFMTLFNSHGDKLIDETRISLSSAGIQVFPDVQVLANDDFVVVWLDGDLDVNAQIKMQRFSRSFTRIGDEIIVKQNIKLNNVKQYNTPIMIQRVINGYVIVWTQTIESIDKLLINFYDQQGNYLSEFDLSQEYKIKNSEPVITSNQLLIVILWETQLPETNLGIVASQFSLNNIFINSQILSKNGEAPSITTLSNGNFIIVWREQIVSKSQFMSQKIIHRQYLPDMSQYLYSFPLGESEYNQHNPDVIDTIDGYAVIFENSYYTDTDIRNLKLQIFTSEGQTKTDLITVTNQQGVYPHHPQLNALPQGEFIASWTSSPITQNSLADDVYMKRYNSDGEQLLLSTVVCINNCQKCTVNDICSVCLYGYILVQERCFEAISNCNNYQSDSNELICTQCYQGYLLISNKCIKQKNLELSVEFVPDITVTFKQIVLSNGNIAAFWSDYNTIQGQQFDQYGKQLTLSKTIINSPSVSPHNVIFFDVISGIDNTYILAYCNIANIMTIHFDQFDNILWQTPVFGIFTQQQIKPSLAKFVIQLKLVDPNTVALFYLNQQVELRMAILSQYFYNTNNRVLLTFSPSSYNDDIEIGTLNGQIQILLPNYEFLTYDNQGYLVSKYTILKNRGIQSSLKQINSTSYIQAWIEVELTSYEVYFQFKQFDGKNITDQIQISSSEELYKFDVEITLLKEIIVSWREGSDTVNMNANTYYKAALISPKTGAVTKITLNYLLTLQANTLQVSQLPNEDLIFSFIVYNETINQYSLTAVKFNPKGQQLEFSTIRCNYGCQECNDSGKCVKCYNSDTYLLQEGNCIKKQTSCKNFQSDCQSCLVGYYKTKSQTCELITQFVETKIQTGLQFYRSAYYSDGRSVIVYQEQQFQLDLIYFDGTIEKNIQAIFSITNDADRIQDFAVLIDEENQLHLFVGLCWQSQVQQNQYLHVSYDDTLNQLTTYVILQNYYFYDHRSLKVKILSKQIGVAIETNTQVYFAVYDYKFTKFIGNYVYSQNQIQDFDFTSGKDNIVFAYTYSYGIVKIYDTQLNFIRDCYITDGSVIKTTVNSLNQIIVVTQNQINIIDQGKIIYSVIDDIYPQAIEVNSLNQIIVLSYTNQIESSLLLKFYDKNGSYEQQVNMLASPKAPFQMFKLSNGDLIIQFQEQPDLPLFAARFDYLGKSRAIDDVICPKNCDVCIANNFCQICSNSYKRNEMTLMCERICTVNNCKSCVKSDCDVCQDGYSLINGQCVVIVYQPLPNEQQVVDQCSTPFDVRILRFSNGDFALVYLCINTIQIKKFNIQSQQLMEYSTSFQSYSIKYDAQIVQDFVYVAAAFLESGNSATIYKLAADFSELQYVTQININNSIISLYLASMGSQYMIVLQEIIQLDGIVCQQSSYFIFDNEQLSKKIILSKNIFIKVSDYVYLIDQSNLTVAKLDFTGQISYYKLQLQPFSQIYFDINGELMVFVFRIVGQTAWQLNIWNHGLIYYRDDQFLFGNYEFSIEATDTLIVITWSNSDNPSIIEYKVLDLYGNLINRKAITNRGQTILPQLIKLQLNVGISWTGMNDLYQYGLSFAIIDQNGEFAQSTMLCSDNCLACTSSNMCTYCNDDYDLIYDFCSKRCSSICNSCYLGICLSCDQGFYPSEETCIPDQVQQTAVQVNEYSEFTQTQVDATSFLDGSVIVVWASMGEDGDSWGVYAQLHDNQGKKFGDNIRISQSTEGAQHSPRVVRLFDNSALVVYIDGDPNTSAYIKGTRFSNSMTKIGNEQLFATFTFTQFQMQRSILDVESLKNGGFVIVWGSQQSNSKQQNLQFYDLAGNLVIQNSILLQDIDAIRISSTSSSFSVIYNEYLIGSRYSVNVYTLDGQLISTIHLTDYNNQMQFVGVDSYYGIVAFDNQIKFQLYNNQFEKSGNPIYIDNSGSIQHLAISQCTTGFYLTIFNFKNYGLKFQTQYFIDLNWQVTQLGQLSVGQVIYVESVNNQYFLIWESEQQNQLDSSNIYLQRFTNQGTLIEIDQIACSSDCEHCDKSSTCTVCVNGFTVIDDLCSPICEQHCSYCTAPFSCDICENGYYQPIEGKCSPLPITYYEPEILLTYDISTNAIGVDQITQDTFAIYTQQTLYEENQEIFQMNLFQNKLAIKTITALVNTLTTNYYTVYPYYIDDNLVLVFYYSGGIVLKRFDSQSLLILDQQVSWPSNIGAYIQYNALLEPIASNQYSLNYAYEKTIDNELIVYQTILDQQLNIIKGPDQTFKAYSASVQSKQKNSLSIMFYDTLNQLVVITSNNIVKMTYIYSAKIQSGSAQIFKIANGNYVQLLQNYYDINNFNYLISGSYALYYRILDANQIPLTTEEKVIENNYLRQNFLNIYVFDNSFTILVEQVNYYKQEISQIIAQRFDNSGCKIGSFQYINSLKNYPFRKDIAYNKGYLIIWELKDYSSEKTQVLAKQYDSFGSETRSSNEAKCIPYCDQCINSYYCQSCSVNYSLDSNYQCQLQCPANCDMCTTPNQCQKCSLGYQVINDQCVKIICISNCAQCSLEGVCNMCDDNYQFITDQCQPVCASNCSSCTIPLQCDTCSNGYVVTTDKKCQPESSSVLTQIQNTTVGTPVIATFPNGDYIMLWYQSGDNAGVYFQLYTKDNVKVGDPTKVGGVSRRRLLTSTIEQQFAADLAVIENTFAVLWLDSSFDSTTAKLQKFDSSGTATSDIVQLGAHPQVDLSNIKLPCQIATTSNNNFLASYIAHSDSSYSLFFEAFDSHLGKKGTAKEIKKVNSLSAPTITADDNGVISLTYQSEGYLFVQQLTEDGEAIDSPKSISDTNSMIIRTTNLEDGFLVFLWENRNLQLSTPQFMLNFQLISKDLKTRSEISSVGTIQNGQMQPDIQSFNSGFIVVWKLTDSSYQSSGLQFQIFDSLGSSTKDPVDVELEGLYPENPRIQIINEESFAITWTAKNVDVDGTILGDGIFMQKYNQYGILVTDSLSTDLCSYKCESCQSPLVCLKCQYGFYLSDNSQCIIDCGSFCDTCTVPWTCTNCKNGYSLHRNGGCMETECSSGYVRNTKTKLCDPQCPEKCTICTEPQKCSACQEGYTLSNSSCTQLVSEFDQQSTIYALIIILLAAGFISMSAFAIAQYCQKKKLLKLTQPSYCQVHPQQDITINNRSMTASCNVSVIRQPNE